jgi:hypothetical protein
MSRISYVQNASEELRRVLVPAYVYSFHQVNRKGCSIREISFVR